MYQFSRFGHQLDGLKVEVVRFDAATGAWLVRGSLGEVFAKGFELV